MKDIHLTEDEQAEQLKQWWKENGVSIISGLVLGISIILGINYWRDYKQTQSEEASKIFSQVLEQHKSKNGSDNTPLVKNIEHLKDSYASTPYAAKSALILANQYLGQGEVNLAIENLTWVLNNFNDSANQHVARIQLARIYMGQGELSRAKDYLLDGKEKSTGEGFESMYQELVGDLAILEGSTNLSNKAYLKALRTLPKGSTYGRIMQYKIDQTSGDVIE